MRSFLFLFLWMVVVAFAEEPVYSPQVYSEQSYSRHDSQTYSKWIGRNSFYSASHMGVNYLEYKDDAGEFSGPFKHGTYSGGGFIFNVKGGLLIGGFAGPFAACDFSYNEGELERNAAKISNMELYRFAVSAGIIAYPFRCFNNFLKGLFAGISVGVNVAWFDCDEVVVPYYDYSEEDLGGSLLSFELGKDFNIYGRFNMGFALVYSRGVSSESENRKYETSSSTGYNTIALVFHVARI